MSDYDLGTARGRIEIEYSGDGVQEASSDIEGLGGSTDDASKALDKVANVAGVAGLSIAGGLGLAVNAAASFEKGLSAIEAVSGATAGEMENIRKKALQIGKDTSFGATDAAKAMEELAKAGLSTTDILGGAADATVALAAAGEVDLPFAAEIASNAMNQFSLKAKDLPNVANKIAGAANASAISVEDFGYSLSQVGAVANLAGLSFDDTAIAIAEMGNAGIKGSDAGTSLKTMLSRLQPTTDKTRALFDDLGLTVKGANNKFYDQQGNLKSLRDIQEILNGSLKNMTAEQKQAALNTLFGSDAIRAAAILTKSGADGYDKMATAINKTKAADVAATRMNNLSGDIEKLKGSAETLAINLGSILIPMIRNIVDKVDEWTTAFTNLSPSMQENIVKIAVVVAGLLIFISTTIKTVRMIQEFIAITKALAIAMRIGPLFSILATYIRVLALAFRGLAVAMLSNPFVIVAIAIIALIAGIVLLWKNCETFRDIVTAVWTAIKDAFSAAIEWISTTGVANVRQSLSDIGGFFVGLWNVVTTVWNGILAVISFVVNAILGVIKLNVNLYVAVITAGMNAIKAVFSAIWNAIVAVVSTAIGAVRFVISHEINLIASIVRGVLGVITGLFRNAWEGLLYVTGAVWNQFGGIVTGAVNGLINILRSIHGIIRSVFSGAGGWLMDAGRNIINGLVEGIKSMVSYVKDWLRYLTSLIPDWKGPASKDKTLLEENGQLIMQGLLNGLGSQVGPLRNLLAGITNDIPTFAAQGTAGAVVAGSTTPAESSIGPAVTVNNYNPVAESDSEQTTKSLTRLAQLGVLG